VFRVIKTYGLTHIALSVKDPERSFRFYNAVLGVVAVYRQDDFIQAQTPGSRDVLVFERGPRTGESGGIAHFGFRLTKPSDLKAALGTIAAAGGTIKSHGEFVPGEPYVFFSDPDGYEVEIWYEIPTSVDPPAPQARVQRAVKRAARRAPAKRPKGAARRSAGPGSSSRPRRSRS
jgi:catechol 2,3-dioxygenase-like lactoylglutathione lyase family enzyme